MIIIIIILLLLLLLSSAAALASINELIKMVLKFTEFDC